MTFNRPELFFGVAIFVAVAFAFALAVSAVYGA
jgi:hypothetical protein